MDTSSSVVPDDLTAIVTCQKAENCRSLFRMSF
jgi:hypothetical protein